MMALLSIVFVLYFIEPAKLRPIINDDLPGKEVFDYLVKNRFLRGPNTIKWRERMMTNMGTGQKPDIPGATHKDLIGNAVFSQLEIKAAIVELQRKYGLPASGKLDKETITFMNSKQPRCNIGITNSQMKNKQLKRPTRVANAGSREDTLFWTFDPTSLTTPTTAPLTPFMAGYIEYAMNVWASVAKVNFKYIPIEKAEQADKIHIIIRFARNAHGDGLPFDGEGGDNAHTIIGEGEDDMPTEIHFDADEKWQINNIRRDDYPLYGRTAEMPDLIQAVIHQIGHVLQFPHSDNPRSVMHCPLIPAKEHEVGTPFALSHEDKCRLKTQKGRCEPPRIDAAYSDTYSGRDYMIVGPLAYKFELRPNKFPYATVEKTWPRPSRDVWSGFEFVDEIFIHVDGHTYFFSGDEYSVHPHSAAGNAGILMKKKIGEGYDNGTKYIGWPGLKHHKYINAAYRYFNNTYIFQDDLVYLWDKSKKGNEDEYHFPKGSVADGWPRKIKDEFPGLHPGKIDTAFHYYWDDRIYFFQKGYFQVWDMTKKKAKPRKHIKEIWKNICNVYMCNSKTTEDDSCRSWEMTRDNCGSLCDT